MGITKAAMVNLVMEEAEKERAVKEKAGKGKSQGLCTRRASKEDEGG